MSLQHRLASAFGAAFLAIHGFDSAGCAPVDTQAPSPQVVRREIDWRKADFDAALAEAARRKAVLFVDLSTSWCGYCRKLEHDTFPDPGVVAALEPMVCVSIDAESEKGRPVAARFAVSSYPTLLFIEPDGTERDRIMGYLAPGPFKSEVERIGRNEATFGGSMKAVQSNPKDPLARLDLAYALRKRRDPAGCDREYGQALALLARDEGYDLKSTDVRWAIAQRMRSLGDQASAEVQMAAIKKLDPEGKTVVMHRLRLMDLGKEIDKGFAAGKGVDTTALRAFLAEEEHEQILFEGWTVVRDVESFAVREAQKKNDAARAQTSRASAVAAAREAWKRCPADKRAEWGRQCAAKLAEFGESLPAEGRDLVAELTR